MFVLSYDMYAFCRSENVLLTELLPVSYQYWVIVFYIEGYHI